MSALSTESSAASGTMLKTVFSALFWVRAHYIECLYPDEMHSTAFNFEYSLVIARRYVGCERTAARMAVFDRGLLKGMRILTLASAREPRGSSWHPCP